MNETSTENVCSTVADELLAQQVARAQVCSTVADELLEGGQICSTVLDEILDEQLRRERARAG
jgi:hypothetical protein